MQFDIIYEINPNVVLKNITVAYRDAKSGLLVYRYPTDVVKIILCFRQNIFVSD